MLRFAVMRCAALSLASEVLFIMECVESIGTENNATQERFCRRQSLLRCLSISSTPHRTVSTCSLNLVPSY
jgi:hypothetical protein